MKYRRKSRRLNVGGLRGYNVDKELGAELDTLLISPVHFHNALHSLCQFFDTHEVMLLLHGLKKLGQLLE